MPAPNKGASMKDLPIRGQDQAPKQHPWKLRAVGSARPPQDPGMQLEEATKLNWPSNAFALAYPTLIHPPTLPPYPLCPYLPSLLLYPKELILLLHRPTLHLSVFLAGSLLSIAFRLFPNVEILFCPDPTSLKHLFHFQPKSIPQYITDIPV